MSYVNMTIGSDIKLSKTGDLCVNHKGDIEIISNEPNIMQSVKNCVITPKGYDEYQPNYGSDLHTYRSQPNSSTARLLAANDVLKAIRLNAKVKQVASITTRKESDTSYAIEVAIVPIDQDKIYNIVFPVRT